MEGEEVVQDPRSVALPPTARAYLAALPRTKGRKLKAAEAAGVSFYTVASWRTRHPTFRALEAEAYRLGMEALRESAIERATEGQKRYFHDKNGNALLDPDTCDCTHGRLEHLTADGPPGARSGEVAATCTAGGCDCTAFRPAPYTEQVASDKLLELLLRAGLPEEFAERKSVEVSAAWKRLDVRGMPHDLIDAVADGAPLEDVVMRLIARGMSVPLLPAPAEGARPGELVVQEGASAPDVKPGGAAG